MKQKTLTVRTLRPIAVDGVALPVDTVIQLPAEVANQLLASRRAADARPSAAVEMEERQRWLSRWKLTVEGIERGTLWADRHHGWLSINNQPHEFLPRTPKSWAALWSDRLAGSVDQATINAVAAQLFKRLKQLSNRIDPNFLRRINGHS